MFKEDKLKDYLSVMARFPTYSVNNMVLIARQNPNATLVAGKTIWEKRFNRQVNENATPIQIYAPVKGSNGAQFQFVNVYDVSQTSGKEITPNALDTDRAKLLDTFEQLSGKTFPKSGDTETDLKMIINDVSHSALQYAADTDLKARCVAFALCQSLKIDTDDFSFSDIENWSVERSEEELKAFLEDVKSTTKNVLSEISPKTEVKKEQSQQATVYESRDMSIEEFKKLDLPHNGILLAEYKQEINSGDQCWDESSHLYQLNNRFYYESSDGYNIDKDIYQELSFEQMKQKLSEYAEKRDNKYTGQFYTVKEAGQKILDSTKKHQIDESTDIINQSDYKTRQENVKNDDLFYRMDDLGDEHNNDIFAQAVAMRNEIRRLEQELTKAKEIVDKTNNILKSDSKLLADFKSAKKKYEEQQTKSKDKTAGHQAVKPKSR